VILRIEILKTEEPNLVFSIGSRYDKIREMDFENLKKIISGVLQK